MICFAHGGAPTTTILAGARAAAAAGGFELVSLLGTSNGTSGLGSVAAHDADAIDATVAKAAVGLFTVVIVVTTVTFASK